jgi:hypothetical protein
MSVLRTKLAWVVAAGTVALAAVPGALALDRPGQIRITSAERGHTYIDNGARGRSPGDVDVYRALIYNRRIQTKPLGHADMVCTSVGGNAQSCHGTFFLPRGEIVVAGVISSRLIYILAVVGGTEFYNNARGTLTVTSLHRSPTRELLLFRLVV